MIKTNRYATRTDETPAQLAEERRTWRRRKRSEVLVFAAPALSTVLADPLMSMFDALVCGRSCSTLEFASLGPALLFSTRQLRVFLPQRRHDGQRRRSVSQRQQEGGDGDIKRFHVVAALCGLAVAALLVGGGPRVVQLTGLRARFIPRSTALEGARRRLARRAGVHGHRLGCSRSATRRRPLRGRVRARLEHRGRLIVSAVLGVGRRRRRRFSRAACLPYLLWLSRKWDGRQAPVTDEGGRLSLFKAAKPLFVFEMGLSVCYGRIAVWKSTSRYLGTAALLGPKLGHDLREIHSLYPESSTPHADRERPPN